MTTDKELQRVLTNPDNVIISESLQGILEDPEERPESNHVGSPRAFAKICGSDFVSIVNRVEIEKEVYTFVLEIPALKTQDLLKSDSDIEVRIDDLEFLQIFHETVSWEDNLLTLKTRRIFNETV